MKKITLYISCLLLLFSCSKTEEDKLLNHNPNNLQYLGLTESNTFPFYPDTFQYLGSNQWYDLKNGDTLIVSRRDAVTDDSGDEIEYRFLIKNCDYIIPLNVKRIHCDASSGVPCYTVFNKQIDNFKLQQYIKNEILACQIETVNGNGLNYPLIDKMWIKLDD
ncbi:hypothetical protein [Flavobacterium sp.]|uniref:hypothetical protein n=1 Tax=Flavobacterium sp. TaxID=239 RepID=UPI0037527BE1